ncbi:MAG: ferric reductase-like transmembrane domain-containing protein [Candidatus Izimaplasma sp.]|nr:ferric reductase-like transmembrane domain-containing protein [Candidatus Izimaplasma bacterium]
MIVLLIHIIIVVVLAMLFPRKIHKYRWYLYIPFAIFALVLLDSEVNVVTLGFSGAAFFIIVMFTGVLERSKIKTKLLQVRAELAVIGTLLIVPHAVSFLKFVLDDLSISDITLSIVFGILTVLVLIPLFVTSFHIIRRQMTYKQWKRLHQLSYLFYTFLGLHLIFIQNDRMVYYISIFLIYGLLKVSEPLIKSYKQKNTIKNA